MRLKYDLFLYIYVIKRSNKSLPNIEKLKIKINKR